MLTDWFCARIVLWHSKHFHNRFCLLKICANVRVQLRDGQTFWGRKTGGKSVIVAYVELREPPPAFAILKIETTFEIGKDEDVWKKKSF